MSEAEGDVEEPKNLLTQEMINENLSQVDVISDGSTCAFTTLVVEEKEIEVLGDAIKNYIHLRNINISKNQLTGVNELLSLPNILTLTAIENQIEDISFLSQDQHNFLQVLNLSQNKIKSLPPIPCPMIRHIILNENEIESCAEFTGHPNLEILELRKNKLGNCDGLGNMPKLKELYLAENPLVSVGQLHTLPNLTKLHLRATEIEKFESFPNLPELEYLNLRETKIEKLEDAKQLEILENLSTVNFLGTPLGDELADGIKKEFILVFPDLYLEKVNKEVITDEDHKEAEELKAERKAEEEEKRRQAEAEGEEKNE
ncbi:unnamed protein product [Moneuplotes crassus]|uniref:Uncharacterized protein n=2 Tax=Euplotes crassus TaxID=5936 RepID=A0AAD1XP45_EUPCR|nr:unnamed protein product [Moneuplotes crassus]